MTEKKPLRQVDKVLQGELDNIYIARLTDETGRRAIYAIRVARTKYSAFEKAAKGTGSFNLNDHGTIIESCYGEDFTPEIKKRLESMFGVMFND